MKDSTYDGFFDEEEEKAEAGSEKTLMAMIDSTNSRVSVAVPVGKRVNGTVLRIGSEYAFVDIGGKNEAMISITEVKDKSGAIIIKPGDILEAYVVSDKNDETMLSKSMGSRGKAAIQDLRAAMAAGLPVNGKVTGVNKGGFNVSILGNSGFCPMSQMDTKFFDDPMKFLSKTFSFVISRLDEGGRNVVVSRLPILEKEMETQIASIEESLESKKVLSGIVSRIADFGLFVDLGGVEGLVHISEVAWERTTNLAERFTVGQPVECVVLKVEHRKPVRDTRISLSVKSVGEDPWFTVSDKLKPGDIVEGTVTRLANFGAFVQILPGIEGLVHVSEMRWGQRVNHPSEVVAEGARVRVAILAVDEAKRSVSCSLKDMADDPWNGIETRFLAGSTVSGKVASKSKFGYFIDLAEGVTGLLPFGNISADKKDSIKPGDSADVIVQNVDTERRRISLSLGMAEVVKDEQEARAYMAQQKTTVKKDASEFGDMLMAALARKK
jgi:small subunit ribosomal protein S1